MADAAALAAATAALAKAADAIASIKEDDITFKREDALPETTERLPHRALFMAAIWAAGNTVIRRNEAMSKKTALNMADTYFKQFNIDPAKVKDKMTPMELLSLALLQWQKDVGGELRDVFTSSMPDDKTLGISDKKEKKYETCGCGRSAFYTRCGWPRRARPRARARHSSPTRTGSRARGSGTSSSTTTGP